MTQTMIWPILRIDCCFYESRITMSLRNVILNTCTTKIIHFLWIAARLTKTAHHKNGMNWNLCLIGGSEILICGLIRVTETALSILYSQTFQLTTTAQRKSEIHCNRTRVHCVPVYRRIWTAVLINLLIHLLTLQSNINHFLSTHTSTLQDSTEQEWNAFQQNLNGIFSNV